MAELTAEPAFPGTLRDWFAGMAPEADISHYREFQSPTFGGVSLIPPKYTREQARYRYADAMMKAREARNG